MTEQEWLECTDPQEMLALLRGKVSDRKLRLFAVACGRLLDPQRLGTASQGALAVAERYADGLATDEELYRAYRSADDALYGEFFSEAHGYLEGFWENAAAAAVANRLADLAVSSLCVRKGRAGYEPARAVAQAALLRDLVGSPSRSVSADASWLTPDVVSLAQAIYDERRFHDLPVLADALEEAGCTDPDILAHLRGPGPHVRGSWVVDLLLDRE